MCQTTGLNNGFVWVKFRTTLVWTNPVVWPPCHIEWTPCLQPVFFQDIVVLGFHCCCFFFPLFLLPSLAGCSHYTQRFCRVLHWAIDICSGVRLLHFRKALRKIAAKIPVLQLLASTMCLLLLAALEHHRPESALATHGLIDHSSMPAFAAFSSIPLWSCSHLS